MDPIIEVPEVHTREEAIAIQLQLRKRLCWDSSVDIRSVHAVAGADVSYMPGSGMGYAAVVALTYPDMEHLESVWAASPIEFPYIPGLLSFREGPLLLEAFRRLNTEPDVLMFDGHGVAHPRRFGIASHMGVILGRPSIGVAKRILTGNVGNLRPEKGDAEPIILNGSVIGMAVRTVSGVKPVYVSIGQKIGLEEAVEMILISARGYRIPEPIRQAHVCANRARRNDERR